MNGFSDLCTALSNAYQDPEKIEELFDGLSEFMRVNGRLDMMRKADSLSVPDSPLWEAARLEGQEEGYSNGYDQGLADGKDDSAKEKADAKQALESAREEGFAAGKKDSSAYKEGYKVGRRDMLADAKRALDKVS